MSNNVNFGCAKFFISADREMKAFHSGLQVERGALREDSEIPGTLQEDWDWHRLMKQCQPGTVMDGEMARLVRREGFTARLIGGLTRDFPADAWESSRQVRQSARRAPPDQWEGFQLFYRMSEKEVRSCNGLELIRAIMGVFAEVTECMNQCMQVRLEGSAS